MSIVEHKISHCHVHECNSIQGKEEVDSSLSLANINRAISLIPNYVTLVVCLAYRSYTEGGGLPRFVFERPERSY